MPSKHSWLLLGVGICGLLIGLVLGSIVTVHSIQDSRSKETETTGVIEQEQQEQTAELEKIIFENEKYVVLDRKTFSKDEKDYKVLHLCHEGSLFEEFVGSAQDYGFKCAYSYSQRLVLFSKGEMINLDGDFPAKSVLGDVQVFPTGLSFMVLFEPDSCAGAEGMCIRDLQNIHLFDLENGRYIGNIPLDGLVFGLDQLSFNSNGTKYINFVPCAEGCPDRVIESYDLVTEQTKDFLDVISRYQDGGLWFGDPQASSWIDNDTFRLTVGNGYDSDKKVKVLDLEF